MTFIITLVSLIIERFFHWHQLRHWRWFVGYQRWLGLYWKNGSSYVLLVACILPLLLATGLINYFLAEWFYGLFQLIFGIFILMYCLGPNNLWVQTYSCINELHKEDPKIAIDSVENAFHIPAPANSQSFHQAFTGAIFVAGYRRVFSVVFWFVILGPVGAVLYRTIALCTEESPIGLTQVAVRVQAVLDWIPVRVMTFLFALAGNFSKVFAVWKRAIKSGLMENEKLVENCGIASLDQVSEEGAAEKEALALLDRVFIIGLIILAIMVLISKT